MPKSMQLWSDGKRQELFQIVLIRLGIILHHRRLCWKRLFTIIAVFGLLSTQAAAASFDCNKAATWLEKTVCSNPELSKLDDQLAKAVGHCEAKPKRTRSKAGDSSLCLEQAPQSESEIATPYGLAMTTLGIINRKGDGKSIAFLKMIY